MRLLHTNPRRFARIAGVFYLLVFIFGIAALETTGETRVVVNLTAAAIYYAVTFMLYQLFRPVNEAGSLVVALFSIVALTLGVLGDLGVARPLINPIVLFGAYCIGLGRLTLGATFLPRAVGVLLIVAGTGWLAHVHPPLVARLGAFAMAPGIVGEGVLTIWLLIAGVDSERWLSQSAKGKA